MFNRNIVLLGGLLISGFSTQASACIPVTNDAASSNITSPGIYCVTEDLTYDQFGYLKLNSSDVIIDFQGHILKGPAHNGVAINPSQYQNSNYGIKNNWTNPAIFKNIQIKNGTISGFWEGIYVTAKDITIENMHIINVMGRAMIVAASGASSISNNVIRVDGSLDTSVQGGSSVPSGMIVSCDYDQDVIKINGNHIAGVSPNPNANERASIGINIQTCNKVEVKDNLVSGGNQDWTTLSASSYAMSLKWSKDVVIENNKFINFSKAFYTYSNSGSVAYDNYFRNMGSACCFSGVAVQDGGGNRIY